MLINRLLYSQLLDKLFKGKVIILFGPRQVGKTTLLQSLSSELNQVLWLNADEPDIQSIFENASSDSLKSFIGNNKIVIIDEAQRLKNVGLKLKLIHDNYPSIQIIATGSSSFELLNSVNEPLTGRKWEYKLYPLSFEEMVNHHGIIKEKRLLEHRLIYGYYPEIVTAEGEEKERLKLLTDSYLYKDILLWEGIQKPDKLMKLVQALAFQVGNQVSNNELARLTGLDSKTVDHYLDLLEKSFIIFRLNSFSRNLRNELKASKKIYFHDNGIRNSVIANYQPASLRQDIGALWENFMIAERMKFNHYKQQFSNSYFWRTKEQKEIDYIEEKDGQLNAIEFKWNQETRAKIPFSFIKNYPEAKHNIIHQGNFESLIYPI